MARSRRARGGGTYGHTPPRKPYRGRQAFADDGRHDYTPEQTAFLMAMDRLRRRLGRAPTWPEVLRAAKDLGYSRGGE